ncbi:MAG: hypothetical protein FJX72_00465 [Armatimonadetes bacterium]|nr:hypothetical protein [Armatimonadota bacterium]
MERTMDNEAIVERVFRSQQCVRHTNPGLAARRGSATIGLLGHRRRLESASREELLPIPGVGPKTVDFVMRSHLWGDIQAL